MIELGRETLAVYDYGPPAEESLGDVVLLHGMTDVARSLTPVAEALLARYRVVAFDARGHGRSSHPGAYSVLHFVSDLARLLDELAIERPVLIGHSLGGHTVANYAGLYPDRPRAIVLIEGLGPPTMPGADSQAAEFERTRAMLGVLGSTSRHRPQPDVAGAAARLIAAHARLDPERAVILAAEGTKPDVDGGVTWRHDERTWHWIASMDQAALRERWAAITVPVLAISGAEAWDTWWTRPGGPSVDSARMTDEQFAACLDLFADMNHVELAEAGHMVHFDQPERLTEIIDEFLRARIE